MTGKTKSARTTILDAVVEVLPKDGSTRSAKEIHQLVVDRGLFTFGAKDPVGVVRSAIRKHLASHGRDGQPALRVRQVERDRFARP